MKFKIPEILLGVLLTIAVLAIGATIPSIYPKEQSREANPNNSVPQIIAKDATDKRIANYTEALAWFTLIMAIGTGALFVVTWRGIANQSRETRILQRAYLSVVPCGVEMTPQGAVVGRINIVNVGHLPARKVTSDARIVWSDDRNLSKFDEGTIPSQTNVLTPRVEMPRGTGALADGRGILKRRQGYIYVFGKIIYEDGFDSARWLTFCHRYNCAARDTNVYKIDAQYGRHHHHYNDGN